MRSLGEFLRETRVPGAVFRGQTRDYGTLIPSLYRREAQVDLGWLEDRLSELFISLHDHPDLLRYRSALYHQGVARAEQLLPSLNFYGESDEEQEPILKLGGMGLFHLLDRTRKGLRDGFWTLDPLDPVEVELDALRWEEYEQHAELVACYRDAPYRVARLQHYGFPTAGIDVTFDPLVALWFATHHLELDDHRGHYLRWNDTGFVYVLQAPEVSLGDLRQTHVIPLAGTRARRQEGGILLGATPESPDLSNHVLEVLEVPPTLLRPNLTTLRYLRRLRRLRQSYLFPGPEDDLLYGYLLRDDSLRQWVVEYVGP